MTLTDFQRQRLDTAVSALRGAGNASLAFYLNLDVAGDPEHADEILRQARAWTHAKRADAARDAVGLLWAVMNCES